MKKNVMTVLGEVNPESLGYTQSHEHIFIEKDKSFEVSEVLWMDDMEKTHQELKEYHKAGGQTVVDAQPVMAGRMAEWLTEVSRITDVNIISSTGFHKTVFYYPESYIFDWDKKKITELYISEIRDGMLSSRRAGFKRTAIKAGLIKTAVDKGGIKQDRVYTKLFESAAQAAAVTKAPVMCHMESGADAWEVIDFFTEHGVAVDQLILAHLDRANYDLAYHEKILSSGVYLEYDTIAREKYHSDEQETLLIQQMIQKGYGNQILLGLDTTRARMRAYSGQVGLDYILVKFIPKLLNFGVSLQEIEQMLKINPARAFAFK